jgi:acetyltransferase-like isoleucine patch superfamily enzyme
MDTASICNPHRDPDLICIGADTVIRGELLTFPHGGHIQIGQHCYLGHDSRVWSARSIRIGDRVLISHNVNIFDNDTHPIDDPLARHEQFKAILKGGQYPRTLDLKEKPVVIENDVLICCQCVVLKGVTIGQGAVVGAGSIVVNDVPPFTVVAGNPARVIRKINSPHVSS